jgi:enolase
MPDSSIVAIKGRRVWDSRGRPTVEEREAGMRGCRPRYRFLPALRRGSREAIDLRDGGSTLGGMNVARAASHVDGETLGAPRPDATGQADIDQSARARRHAQHGEGLAPTRQ